MTAEAILKKIEIDTSNMKEKLNLFIKKFNEDTDYRISENKNKIEDLKKNFENALSKLEKESKTKEEANEANEGQYRRKMKELREDLEDHISKLEKASKKREAQLEVQRMDIESLKESYMKEIKSLKEESAKEIISLKEDSKKKEAQMKTQRKEIDTFKKNSAEEIKSLKAQLEVQRKDNESLKENYVKEIKFLKEDSTKKEAQIEMQRKEIETFKNDFANEITSLKEDSKKKETQMETQRKEIESLNEVSAKEIKSLKENSVEEIKSLKEDSAKEINSLKSEVGGISVMAYMIKEGAIMSGETTLTIDRIDNKMEIAEEKMISPYFYSHYNGYKLRLEVFPGGHNGGCGSHVSLYVQICKGEFDTELLWPCKYSFHVSVVNQRSGGTHNTVTLSRDIASDNNEYCYNHSCSYNRPISDYNIGCGYDKFILHSDLRKVDGLRVNDRIIIKCVVTAPK